MNKAKQVQGRVTRVVRTEGRALRGKAEGPGLLQSGDEMVLGGNLTAAPPRPRGRQSQVGARGKDNKQQA